MEGAVVGVSKDLEQFTRFNPGSTRNSLRMHTCAPLCQVERSTGTVTVGTALQLVSNSYVSCQLNMTHPAGLTGAGAKALDGYTSPVFDLIASAFVRYKVHKLVFHYEPQSSATTTERLVFAFAEDPLHPVLWNASVPNQSSLLSLANSVAFMPWKSWSMDVSEQLSESLFYTFSDPTITVDAQTERFSDFGVISILTDTFNTSNATCGVLYMEIDVEFFEFCPISVTRPSLKILANKLNKLKDSDCLNYKKPGYMIEQKDKESKCIRS